MVKYLHKNKIHKIFDKKIDKNGVYYEIQWTGYADREWVDYETAMVDIDKLYEF
jgi:hypothetical protein